MEHFKLYFLKYIGGLLVVVMFSYALIFHAVAVYAGISDDSAIIFKSDSDNLRNRVKKEFEHSLVDGYFNKALEVIRLIDAMKVGGVKQQKNLWVKRLTATPSQIEELNKSIVGAPPIGYIKGQVNILRELQKRGDKVHMLPVINGLEKLETLPQEDLHHRQDINYKAELKTALVYLSVAEVYAGNLYKAFSIAYDLKKKKGPYSHGFRSNNKSLWNVLAAACIESGHLFRAYQAIWQIESKTEKTLLLLDAAEKHIATGHRWIGVALLEGIESRINQYEYPEVKSHILQTLSKAFYQVGDVDSAKRTLDLAKKIYVEDVPKSSPLTSLSNDRPLRFYPLQDILNNYALQKRHEEIATILSLKGYGLSQRDSFHLIQAAIYAASINNIDAVDFLLDYAQEGFEIIEEKIQKNQEEYRRSKNLDIHTSPEAVKRQKTRGLETTLRYILDVSVNLAKHKQFSKARHLLDQSERAMGEFIKLKQYKRKEYIGLYINFIVKKAIVIALIEGDDELSSGSFESIVLAMRSYAYGVNLMQFSQLLHESGLLKDSQKALDMAYNTQAGQGAVNGRLSYTKTYHKLANIYTERGLFSKASEVTDATLIKGHPYNYKNAQRAAMLLKERYLAQLAIKAHKQREIADGNRISNLLTHPFYKYIVAETLGSKSGQELSLSMIVQDAWSSEELAMTIPFLTYIAKLRFERGQEEGAAKIISYAMEIEEVLGYGFRAAEAHIIISNYYRDIHTITKAREHLEEAQGYLKFGEDLVSHRRKLLLVVKGELKDTVPE